MRLDPPLRQGTLVKRYKRFLADIIDDRGEAVTIHCPNTGSMRACLAPGEACWYSTSDNPKRKYEHTWEIATTPAGDLAGVNTGRANALVVEAIQAGVIPELSGFDRLETEVRYGDERSRIDVLLHYGDKRCYAEVKNVTLCEGDGQGLFPDSISARGTKHLRELMLMRAQGHRAVLIFCVQHSGIKQVSPAEDIDSLYAETLRAAARAGVEILAYAASLSAEEIVLTQALPVRL